jgi:hypothetical protein
MERITEKNLQGLCDTLNRMKGAPEVGWIREGKRNVAQVGHYCLDMAYGGYRIVRICSEGGGIETPISDGFDTKRECYEKACSYIKGMRDGDRYKRI